MKSNRKALKKRIAELEDAVRRRRHDLLLRNHSFQEMNSDHNSDELAPILDNTRREEIERDFVNWRSPASIAKEYGVKNQLSIYRHAHESGLIAKRQRNVRAALERIIERADEVQVSASAVVSAVGTYARINAAGQWVERSERIDLNQLFERMSTEELEEYVKGGTLPNWFTGAGEGVTPDVGRGGKERG